MESVFSIGQQIKQTLVCMNLYELGEKNDKTQVDVSLEKRDDNCIKYFKN